MNKQPNPRKKILHVSGTMNTGGVESFLMSVLRATDCSKYEIVFLTYSKEHFDYEDEILKLGSRILRVDTLASESIFKHIYEITKILKSEKVDVITSHTYFNSALVMIAASLARVPRRIVHSHTTFGAFKTSTLGALKQFTLVTVINLLSNSKVACSDEAGMALFKKRNFSIIPNGIDFSKFKYDKDVRAKYRDSLEISPKTTVIGHVGRLEYPKNHQFLIDMFKAYLKLSPNALLLLIGTGKLERKLKTQVEKNHIKDNVIFLGNREDVSKLLNIMDFFVFPSIYEGLPVTLIEAQANGMPILASDAVSPEAKISSCLEFLSLNSGKNAWATRIASTPLDRINTKTELAKSTFNITTTLDLLNKLYEQGSDK